MNNSYAAKKLLMEVGVSPDLKGYHYLADAICTTKEMHLANQTANMMEMYHQIAKTFDTTASRVERSMRHAIEKAFLKNNALLNKTFNTLIDDNDKKATNSCFVCTLAEHLILLEI